MINFLSLLQLLISSDSFIAHFVSVSDVIQFHVVCILVCVQLMNKLKQHQTYVDGISFDDIADLPAQLESQWQQLKQFEENFEVC